MNGLRRIVSVGLNSIFGGRNESIRKNRIVFSFIVDEDPKFAYQGYHLARSLIEFSSDAPSEIHVQFTSDVGADIRKLFSELGCTLHQIDRFGDGRYCNKISQLANLHDIEFDIVVLLDTDMIVLGDLRPSLSNSEMMAKVVDLPNPSLDTLKEIALSAGMKKLPPLIEVDASDGVTFAGNWNGGFYSIPKSISRHIDTEWRSWATWLLSNIDPLRKVGKEMHVDQIAMWLAINMKKISYRNIPSNLNYYIHFTGMHRYFDTSKDIALIHYHDSSLNVLGKLSPSAKLNNTEISAINRANEYISKGFESKTFWNFRYAKFPERGSGVGSRGDNLLYKRTLLIENFAEEASSVLDVGCGDLEVVKALNLRNYLGVDTAQRAIELAGSARGDWDFQLVRDERDWALIPPKDMVICFEVLIHQRKSDDYHTLVRRLVERTEHTLIVSGYGSDYLTRAENSMLYFYEPLDQTLRSFSKFKSIERIGRHSDVTVFCCKV